MFFRLILQIDSITMIDIRKRKLKFLRCKISKETFKFIEIYLDF